MEVYPLSPEEMAGKTILEGIHLVIPFTPLVQNNIDNLVVLADVFCGSRHYPVNHLAE